MAWTAPRTWVTGELVTASILNTHVRDNETELRAGGIAMASQAIGDLVYASSTTQFSRIAAVATGQVLKSAGTGTVPAWGTINVAFLSDGSNVALLNASNTFTVAAASAIVIQPATTTNAGYITFTNTGGSAFVGLDSSTGGGFNVGNYALALYSGTATGIGIKANDAAGQIKFYTGGNNLRWGINAAGDFTFGTSSHISDSAGTPSIASGFGGGTPSIVGTDYAFKVVGSGGGSTTGTVNFGHTWTTTPICVATTSRVADGPAAITGVSTTQVSVDINTAYTSTQVVFVLCRSY